MNELERLLERATLEPAFGPLFYQALLTESVYVLLPAGAVFTERGTVRFIMWTGQDGKTVIPFFSSRAAIRRVLTPQLQSFRLAGRAFLEACRGGIVVLNPNEQYSCRLNTSEISLLLDTGSPNAPETYTARQEMNIELRMPDVPADLLNSMSLLFAQIPDVERAYVVVLRPTPKTEEQVWLVAMVIDSDTSAQLAAGRVTALLADRPPASSVDLLSMRPGSANALEIEAHIRPFYERSLGESLTRFSPLTH